MSSETHRRSIAKAISWRATGTADTFLISWIITGEPLLATGIAGTELATKITLYYLHERVWSRVPWGRGLGAKGGDSRGRSIAKAVSWRTTGTIDTFLISWLITGNAGTASGIAATEVLTKVALFYFHERIWDRISWGRPGTVAIGTVPTATSSEQPDLATASARG